MTKINQWDGNIRKGNELPEAKPSFRSGRYTYVGSSLTHEERFARVMTIAGVAIGTLAVIPIPVIALLGGYGHAARCFKEIQKDIAIEMRVPTKDDIIQVIKEAVPQHSDQMESWVNKLPPSATLDAFELFRLCAKYKKAGVPKTTKENNSRRKNIIEAFDKLEQQLKPLSKDMEKFLALTNEWIEESDYNAATQLGVITLESVIHAAKKIVSHWNEQMDSLLRQVPTEALPAAFEVFRLCSEYREGEIPNLEDYRRKMQIIEDKTQEFLPQLAPHLAGNILQLVQEVKIHIAGEKHVVTKEDAIQAMKAVLPKPLYRPEMDSWFKDLSDKQIFPVFERFRLAGEFKKAVLLADEEELNRRSKKIVSFIGATMNNPNFNKLNDLLLFCWYFAAPVTPHETDFIKKQKRDPREFETYDELLPKLPVVEQSWRKEGFTRGSNLNIPVTKNLTMNEKNDHFTLTITTRAEHAKERSYQVSFDLARYRPDSHVPLSEQQKSELLAAIVESDTIDSRYDKIPKWVADEKAFKEARRKLFSDLSEAIFFVYDMQELTHDNVMEAMKQTTNPIHFDNMESWVRALPNEALGDAVELFKSLALYKTKTEKEKNKMLTYINSLNAKLQGIDLPHKDTLNTIVAFTLLE